MLEKLGIYGMETIERAILVGLVTGDPVLLVGGHGSGKTLLCSRLAQALGLKFWAYDASKAMFEDVLGFPNPESITAGEVEYVPTPISIWGKEFVLIDELSRANPAMQNKWLEVIRARTIMGKKIAGLKYVFAAMNPPSYIGAHPLDPALAGRFAVVVKVPEVGEMDPAAVSRIVQQFSEDDAPLLSSPRRHPRRTELAAFVDACRQRMEKKRPAEKEKLADYVRAAAEFLASREVNLDARRLGMMWRTLLGYLAVVEEMEGRPRRKLEEEEENIFACLPHTVPFAAQGEEQVLACLRAAHFYARAALNGGVKGRVFVMKRDPLAAVQEYVRKARELVPDDRRAALSSFLQRVQVTKKEEQKAPAILAVLELASFLCRGELELEPDDQHRLLAAYLRFTVMPGEECSEFFIAWRKLREGGGVDDSPSVLTCLRAAYAAYPPETVFPFQRSYDSALRLAREMLSNLSGR